MILSWMVATIVFTVVMSAAAWSLNHFCARLDIPRRWSAISLMLLSVALPLLQAVIATGPSLPPVRSESVALAAPVSAATTHTIDQRIYLLLWLATSITLALVLLLAQRRVRRVIASSAQRDIGGKLVTITDNVGPAVFGFHPARVVVPAWVLHLAVEDRTLVLEHELQHVDAGDQLTLLAGVMLAVLMPWNLGLWWQLRRLRVAIEVDCDRRVAPSVQDRPRYAALLLRTREVAHANNLALAFASSQSALGERVLALIEGGASSNGTSFGWFGAAALSALIAVRIPIPVVLPIFSLHHQANVSYVATVASTFAENGPLANTARMAADIPKDHRVARVTKASRRPVDVAPSNVAPAVEPSIRYDVLEPYVQPPPPASRASRAAGPMVLVPQRGASADSLANHPR